MTSLQTKILALEKLDEKDPAFKESYKALKIDLRNAFISNRSAANSGTRYTNNENPYNVPVYFDKSINRSEYINRVENDKGALGYNINNWSNSSPLWTSTGVSSDEELGNSDYIAVNGLRLRFIISEGEYMGFSVMNSSSSLSSSIHYVEGWSGSEYQEAQRIANYDSFFQWVDYGAGTITSDAYFKFTVLKVENGIVKTARVDMFSRTDGDPVLAMQVLLLWTSTNLYQQIEFRPRYYLDTALGTVNSDQYGFNVYRWVWNLEDPPQYGDYISDFAPQTHGSCRLEATGIPDLTMSQIRSQSLWNTSSNARGLWYSANTYLDSNAPTRDSLYIRYLHGSFATLPRTL